MRKDQLSEQLADDFKLEVELLIKKWLGNCEIMNVSPVHVLLPGLVFFMARITAATIFMEKDVEVEKKYAQIEQINKVMFFSSYSELAESKEGKEIRKRMENRTTK